MNETIITGLFTLLGALIGGSFSLLVAWQNRKHEEYKRTFVNLCEQVRAYWNLEKLYCAKVAELENRAEQTVMNEFRAAVVEKGYDRPKMTEKEAEGHLDKYR